MFLLWDFSITFHHFILAEMLNLSLSVKVTTSIFLKVLQSIRNFHLRIYCTTKSWYFQCAVIPEEMMAGVDRRSWLRGNAPAHSMITEVPVAPGFVQWQHPCILQEDCVAASCSVLVLCSLKRKALLLYWSSTICHKLQAVNTIVLAWPHKALFHSALQVMYHMVLFTLVFKNRFCSEKLCRIWGIFMPYKFKIVLIRFLKAHADLTLDDAEVVEILPCFDGIEWSSCQAEESYFKCLRLFQIYTLIFHGKF